MSGKEEIKKVYENVCAINPNITYKWNSQINRDGGKSGHRTENNNALIKVSPAFLNEVQKKNSKLVSARRFIEFICEKLDIAFKEEFAYYGFLPLETTKPKADTTARDKAIIEAINKAIKQKKTPKQIRQKMANSGLTPDEILKFLPKLPNEETLTETLTFDFS